ncbi:hypothetical protein ZWY2020_050610 [Hordeum vulgare]|nr:hypothetical protein ZWY2020_050610 [Hordeum vulgare]
MHLHYHGGGLPEEIIVWEILVRLSPKSLLRCRTVCRTWRRVTTSRDFLLAHHAHWPSLPIVNSHKYPRGAYDHIHTFDHRAVADAQIQPIARLDKSFRLTASCDGLVIQVPSFGVKLL